MKPGSRAMTRMMHFLGTACWLATGALALGQYSGPSRQDREALNEQAGALFEALRPVVKEAAEGTVEVRVWRKRVGFGSVVAPERVLAKWSEVKRDVRSLSCRTRDGRWLPAEVQGIYRDADLALLRVSGLEAEPLRLDGRETDLELGEFLALARPDGEAASMGVVSVLPRSLRQSDRAFLGIEMDLSYEGPGVKVREVEPETGAARAGLEPEDVVMRLGEQEVNGGFELSTALQRMQPGERVELAIRRQGEERQVAVELGGRPDPRRIPFSRMERMNNMGGHRYSDVRDGFRDVIQSDMQIEPEDCGAPVVDLEGRVVGFAVARAGRIKSFLIPVQAMRELLAAEPEEPRLDELAGRAEVVEEENGEDPFEVMRRKMEEMQRLMEDIEGRGR